MKKFFLCLTVVFCTIQFSFLQAQSENKDGQKEITLSVEMENGVKSTTVAVKSANGDIKQYEWQGEEMPVEIKNELDDLQINIETIEKEGITTTIEQRIVQEKPANQTAKEVQVIIKNKDGDKVMEWQGEDELPADIQLKVDELKELDSEHSNGNKIIIRSGNGEEKIFEWTGDEIPEEIKNQLNEADLDLAQEIEVEKEGHAILGIAIAMTVEKTIENNQEIIQERLEVADVTAGSGAESAGLLKGDEILRINEIAVTEADEIVNILSEFKPGDTVPITVKRDNQELTKDVTLTEAIPSEVNKKRTIVIEKNVKRDGASNSEANKNNLKLEELVIHPNPTKDVINISIKGEKGPLSISISDIEGKNILRKEVDEFDGAYQDQIDLHNFPKGPLVIQIEQNGKIHNEKVVRM